MFFFGVVSGTNTFYAFLVTCLLSKPCVVLLRCCCFISQFVHKTNTRKYQYFCLMTIILSSRKKTNAHTTNDQDIHFSSSFFSLVLHLFLYYRCSLSHITYYFRICLSRYRCISDCIRVCMYGRDKHEIFF